MDLLRKFLGLPSSPHYPGYNEHLDDNYSDDQFPRGGSPNGQYDSYYTEQHTGSGISDPMEDMTHMMHMMEQLIAGISVTMINPDERFLQYPPNPLEPLPPSGNPRDALLRQPDVPTSDSHGPGAQYNDGDLQQQPSQITPFNKHERSYANPFMDAFSMLDHFAGVFGNGDSFSRPHSPNDAVMDPSTPSSSVPRDKLLKREDQDLDLESKSSADISAILKDGPGYSYGSGTGPSNVPSNTLQPYQQPTVRRSYTSTSISRVVKPDGSVEERRTYRDHTGKEEVTVTQLDPSAAGSLLSSQDPFRGGVGGLFGSLFR